MRVLLLLLGSLLVLSINALPGRKNTLHERINKNDPDEFPNWCEVCKSSHNRTSKSWQRLEMDDWLGTMSDSLWDGTDDSFKGSFVEGIESKIEGDFGGIKCTFDDCGFDFAAVTDLCMAKGWNAFYLYVLFAISNLQLYLKSLRESFEHVCQNAADDAGLLTDTFADHDSSPDKSPSSALIITSAVMAGIAALIIPGGEALMPAMAGAGAASAQFGIANGILTAIKDAEPNPALSFDKQSAVLSHTISEASTTFWDRITKWGANILEKNVDIDSLSGGKSPYHQQMNSAPWALHGGKFSRESTSDTYKGFKDSSRVALRSGQVSWLWGQEQIFIVKVSEPINGKAPCDMDLDGTLDLKARVCEDGTAWFFIKNTGLDDDWQAFDEVPGYKSLNDWDLDPLTFAKAAEASQKACDCWKPVRKPGETIDFMQGEHSPKGSYMVNLPVCDLDRMKSEGAWKGSPTSNQDVGERTDDVWVRFYINNACWKQKVDGAAWPYEKLERPKK
ncbi:hypothetical protein NUU61_006537 [Penicillium alfredii]|uniref:Uncharacterized protein n=1 Tax=Penicillium alfredii TaxID=1506179 RepID=A0A9W9K4C6_9EURO|nr:uncharacterized protein NUU61_006537 [Penicillium alfredii]KAJ5091667.1 hypothetical protein NUU61_006537 [Penicillium alfredii]